VEEDHRWHFAVFPLDIDLNLLPHLCTAAARNGDATERIIEDRYHTIGDASAAAALNAKCDVLIVGAGPGGLALANDLAARGISFRVIDPLPEAVRDSRAHGMLGRTVMALDKLGLAEPMLGAAKKPTPVMREYFGTKLTETDFAKVPRDPYPLMVPIFQQSVVRVLETALEGRGHRVEWSSRMLTFVTDGDGVTAEVDRNGTRDSIRAGWIVGCDGGRSAVRKTLRVDFPGESSSQRGLLICECDLDWNLSRDIWWTWHGRAGFAAAIYNDFSGKWHILIHDLGQQDPRSGPVDLELISVLLRKYSGERSVKLSNPSKLDTTASSNRVAADFVVGRAALAGDAAHLFGGAAGEGMHCAIEDALNLGWKLGLTISGAAASSLLETYQTERHGHADSILRDTRWVYRFMTLRGIAATVLWSLVLTIGKLLHFGSVGAIGSKQVNKLASNYGKSPLSRQDSTHPTAGTRAGHHVPDVECRAGGRPSRLSDIIRGPQANLLLFTGASPATATVVALRLIEKCVGRLSEHVRVNYVFPSQAYATDAGFGEDDPRVIVDGLEKLQSGFGIRNPELVYIRPDGYIGLRTQQLGVQTLLNYLHTIYSNTL
jgi:2-polyprenyl-6-methoxyphenol hydroxylase-like FAD-dependent oxidoreductase